MLKKLGLVDLHAAIKERIEAGTGLSCYDKVPKNTKAPFYFVQIVNKRPEDTKTMFCEVFTVWIHAIAEPGRESTRIYELIQLAEESMTEEITLPAGVELIRQAEQGIQTIQTDETKEKHAVLAYDFKVSYGFKTKI